MPPSIWPSTRQRVERTPDVLRGGDLHHLDQPELGVDVDDGAVGDERERRVAVALAVLVEFLGRRVVVLDGLVERRRRRVASATGSRQPDTVSTTSVAVDRRGAAGRRRATRPTCSNSRSRTVRHAASTAPPLIHVWRDADVEPAEPTCGVDAVEHDVVDAEDRAGDLRGDRDEPLADLGGGELQRGDAVGEAAAGGRVVVEPLGVHQVLDRHAPADAAHDVADDRRCGRRRRAAASRRCAVGLGDRRPARRAAAARRCRGCTARPGRRSAPTWPVISGSPVRIALRSRISTGSSPHGRGQLVHLGLVGEAGLHHAEPAHRAARQVVGAHRPAVDDGVRAPVRTLGVGDGVDQHRRRRRGVGAAVEHDPRLDLDDLAVGGGVVAHPDRRRVPVDVAEEALRPAVGDAHRPAQCAARAGRCAPAG